MYIYITKNRFTDGKNSRVVISGEREGRRGKIAEHY